jgi:FkbM family methyltransferase
VSSAWVKEPGTIAWIRDEVHAGDVVWDIGANIGIYSIPLGHRVRGSGGRVIAVEPSLASAASLAENIAVNDLGGVVHLVCEPVAATTSDGTMSISRRHLESGKSGLQFRTDSDQSMSAPMVRFVRSVSPADLQVLTGSSPTIIKIDVDGLDYEILEGLKAILMSESRPRFVSVEMRADEPRFVALMESLGYELREMNFSMGGSRKIRQGKAPSLVSGNGIFVPRDVPAVR